MSGQEGKDCQGCILWSSPLDSGSLFTLLSATTLMYSFSFEELDTGEWFAGINKLESGIVLVWAS